MKGSHKVIVETDRIKYEFTIRRNITVILGNSATGKTTLVDLLSMYSRRGKGSGVSVQSDVPCIVFNALSGIWQRALEEISGSIIFIDEGQPFIFSKEFAEFVQDSDNYFVLITRRPLYNLPYSTKEIYGIRTSGKYHFPQKVYQEFYPIYTTEAGMASTGRTVLLLEDSNAGYEFFRRNLPNISCECANGNAGLASKANQIDKKDNLLVIADGAAFGAYIENLVNIYYTRKNLGIFLPESFEWMILKSGVISKSNISDILEHPEDYVDSSVYLSWERFFTELLIKETAGDELRRYSKSHLSDYYISESIIRKVLNIMPEDIRAYLEK